VWFWFSDGDARQNGSVVHLGDVGRRKTSDARTHYTVDNARKQPQQPQFNK